MTDRNQALFDRAAQVIPGGVNSPVRAFRAVGGTPRFVQRAQGAYFWDANGKKYIDYIGSWGPMILGHGHPAVLEAVQKAALDGFSFGAPTEREMELAEAILKHVPSMEMVRWSVQGTEAGMSALRLARGATGRSKFIKFEGCYHGHADALLVKAGSGLATFGNPTSAGVPPEVVRTPWCWNTTTSQQLEEAFALHGKELACVMIEPIAGNMNFVRASVPFMTRCRELCTEHGALLVFDEVMSGFRVALGSAQSVYAKAHSRLQARHDGAGQGDWRRHALGRFWRPREIMRQLAPTGPVYQAGTLSGNPVATACGLTTLREIAKPGFYEALSARTQSAGRRPQRCSGQCGCAFQRRLPRRHVWLLLAARVGAKLRQVMTSDSPKFNKLFHGMLDGGVYIAPALYEAGFVSAAHTEADIAETVRVAAEVFKTL
jgi:glutamate-1-semialdehyde 2,1-aminomutase